MQTKPASSLAPNLLSPCLSEDDVLGLLNNTPAGSNLQSFRLHLATCEPCALLVSEAARAMRSADGHTANEVDVAPSSRAPEMWTRFVVSGSVLNERYLLREPLGQGGMGIVVEAWDLQLSRLVALKCLLASGPSTKAQRARFQREALLLSKSAGQHVVQIFDAGTCAQHGFPFLVMERLEGEDLASRIKRGPPLTVAEVCLVAAGMARALQQAHGQGVVHRDLKPGNVFLQVGDNLVLRVKLLDFGISKVLGIHDSEGEHRLTRSRVFLGTAAYAAPEQIRNPSAVTPAADIWSLGVVVYEMLYGRLPFPGDNLADVLAGALHAALIVPARGDVPRALERLLRSALVKDPGTRVQTASAFLDALANVGPAPAWRVPRGVAALVGIVGTVAVAGAFFAYQRKHVAAHMPAAVGPDPALDLMIPASPLAEADAGALPTPPGIANTNPKVVAPRQAAKPVGQAQPALVVPPPTPTNPEFGTRN